MAAAKPEVLVTHKPTDIKSNQIKSKWFIHNKTKNKIISSETTDKENNEYKQSNYIE